MTPEKLKEIRKKHGLSQNDAAASVCVSQRTWARYEQSNRKKKVPRGIIELFCIKNNIDIDEFSDIKE